jgi:hypothetical protein
MLDNLINKIKNFWNSQLGKWVIIGGGVLLIFALNGKGRR